MTELIFVLLSVFFFSHINAIYSRHPYEFEEVKVEYRAKNFMALVAFGYYTDGWGSLEELLRRLDLDDVKGTLKKLPDDCKSIKYLTKVADRDLIEAGFREEQIDMLKNEPLTLKQNPQGSAKVMPVVSGGGKTETRGEAYGDLIPLKEWRRAAGEAEHAKRALAKREKNFRRSTPPGVSKMTAPDWPSHRETPAESTGGVDRRGRPTKNFF